MSKVVKKNINENIKSEPISIDFNEVNFLTSNTLFSSLDMDGDSKIVKKDILESLNSRGILNDDPRIKETIENLKKLNDNDSITPTSFNELISKNITLIERALKGDLIIPDFSSFSSIINTIYESCKSNMNGKVADYIPQLARVSPENYAISICTVDGQRLNIGNTDLPYCVQSTCKPINYCIALEDSGVLTTHKHVGREPSGRGFNELTLNKDGRPHNPMINAGAIMTSSLINPEMNVSDRFDHVLDKWEMLTGGRRPGFNNAVYLSEKQTADRNFALGYFMKENKAFPENTNLHEILEFYFQCCSIEINCSDHAILASTLANAGICPITRKRVFSAETTKNCLSLMYSCGMYDFSGEFAFSVGLPAKSGVSGCLVLVVPGVCGITIWSPKLDEYGNSVKAVQFAQKLVRNFNFHNYDNLVENLEKKDPRLQKNEEKLKGVMAVNFAVSQGDLNEIKSLEAKGINLNESDYDGRTPIHLAASEGHLKIIEYFISKGLDLDPKDRWGGTPLDDAKRHSHESVSLLLEQNLKEVIR